jgi:hypothetical protein
MKKKIGNFVLCWIGWWFFSSAAVSLTKAAYCYAMSKALTPTSFAGAPALFMSAICSLFLTIWWFLVVVKR